MQALLTELQQLSSPVQLRGWVADQRPRLSLSFLQWLAGLEAQAQGQEQQQLSILCGQLVAAREGLGEFTHHQSGTYTCIALYASQTGLFATEEGIRVQGPDRMQMCIFTWAHLTSHASQHHSWSQFFRE